MSSSIYHGPWINWSNGNFITGATITVSDNSGGLLTSFIATFVALVGVQLWKILAFIIHQVRSTTRPEDGLYHQQQALWRNSSAPGGAAWTLLQQMWFWRNKANRAFVRTASWALFAIVYLVVFGIAAVFSSQISKAPGPQRLVVGDQCGYWATNQSSPDRFRALRTRNANESTRAATYARACYDSTPNALQCSKYTTAALPWTSNKNASCPFSNSSMCLEGPNAAFELTTELLDSHVHLGINTPKKYRVQFQKRTTCAPLLQVGYTNYKYEMIPDPNGTLVRNYWFEAKYGPWNTTSTFLNYTDRVALHGSTSAVGYRLTTAMHYANVSSDGGWYAIPSLSRETADTTLLFLGINAIRFDAPSDDPWISAHWQPEDTTNTTWWSSDEYMNTLGCTEDYRLCNPNNGKCTEYLGSYQHALALANLTSKPTHIGFNEWQNMVAIRLNYAFPYSGLEFMTWSRGSAALRAQETVAALQQAPLPANQWHIEVSSWFNGGLASIQQRALEYATGPSVVSSGAYVADYSKAPDATTIDILGTKYLCANQLINDSNETMSFSVLGMAVLFVIGGIILILSLVVDRVVGFFQARFNLNIHGRRAWARDDKLQLQRTMFEKSGMGRWRDDDDDSVPVTLEKDRFPRFAADEVFSPNTPDGPVDHDQNGHFYQQKTEYMSPYSKVPSVTVQAYPHQPQPYQQQYHQ